MVVSSLEVMGCRGQERVGYIGEVYVVIVGVSDIIMAVISLG